MPSNASSAAQEPSPSSLYRNTPHPIMVATKSVSPVEQFLRSESGRITEFYTNMCFDLFVDSDTLGWLVLNQKYLKVMEGGKFVFFHDDLESRVVVMMV